MTDLHDRERAAARDAETASPASWPRVGGVRVDPNDLPTPAEIAEHEPSLVRPA